jgi:hypothetical protein
MQPHEEEKQMNEQTKNEFPPVYQAMIDELRAIRALLEIIAAPPAEDGKEKRERKSRKA